MKKLSIFLLIMLMLISVFVSCGGNDETTTTKAPATNNSNAWSSKNDIRKTWSGKTLNIACSTWDETPSAPWSPVELCVEKDKESGFGTIIDTAVLEREDFIKNTYGVTLKFINATRWNMHDALSSVALAGNLNYDIAMPRMKNVQSMVAGGHVYDLAGRDFIDFRNSYYNENSVKTFTANGHTFFVTGSFSFLDKQLSNVLYFNKNILGDGSEKASNDLYQLVKDGKWTYDKLITYAEAAYTDDGDGIKDYDDVYGAYMQRYDLFYNSFGVTQTGVNGVTGKWEITVNDSIIDDVIGTVLDSINADWQKPQWFGYWISDFTTGKYLFHNNELSQSQVALYGNIGIVPFPMLNEDQDRYCVAITSSMQIVLMCIPRTTQDRAMSEYFFDVLSWTGEEYTMRAYMETKKEHFTADADMEMLKDYIIPNIFYDAGHTAGWDSVMDGIEKNSYKDNENRFDEVYAEKEPDALKIIAEWNTVWGSYTDN